MISVSWIIMDRIVSSERSRHRGGPGGKEERSVPPLARSRQSWTGKLRRHCHINKRVVEPWSAVTCFTSSSVTHMSSALLRTHDLHPSCLFDAERKKKENKHGSYYYVSKPIPHWSNKKTTATSHPTPPLPYTLQLMYRMFHENSICIK